jgi:hypothetical protein
MTRIRQRTERDRRQEEETIDEAKRGPTAVGQGRGDDESGADSARGMQTGAENDLTRPSAGSPTRGKQAEQTRRRS